MARKPRVAGPPRAAARPRITGRSTSINAAFVQAIIPRHVDHESQRALYKACGIDPNKCSYCGNPRTDWDHLNPIVRSGKPSGHFHVTENIVPACGPCNQSKSGLPWRDWMTGNARGSPATRKIKGLKRRVDRLVHFQQLAGLADATTEEVLREAVGPKLWDAYWAQRDEILRLMRVAQAETAEIERRLSAWYRANHA